MENKINKIHRFKQAAFDAVDASKKGYRTRDADYSKEVNRRLLNGDILHYPEYQVFVKVERGTNWMISKDGIYWRNSSEMKNTPFFSPEKFEFLN